MEICAALLALKRFGMEIIMKKRIGILILTGAVGTGLIGCGLMPKEEEYPTAPVLSTAETEEYKVAEVVRSNIQNVEEIRAIYTAATAEKYSFKVGGEEVSEIYVQLGDIVKEGDVLIELDVTAQRNQVRQQQEQVDDLYLQLKHLDEETVLNMSEAQLQDQQAQQNGVENWNSQVEAVTNQYENQRQLILNSLYLAELRLDKAETEMKNRQIIASIEGTVTDLHQFQEGEVVQKGKTVVKIADLETAMFQIYSEDTELLKDGEIYELICEKKKYEVMAEYVEGENDQEAVIYLRMTMPDPDLETGATGLIQFVTAESKNVLCIPSEAIQETEKGYRVYCVGETGFREIRDVEIGINNGVVAEVISGLEEGEQVIID